MSRTTHERRARFEELFDRNRSDLLAYALRRTRSPEDAADVLGDTFLIAWRRLDTIPQGDRARLWLFGVARNVIRRGVVRERTRHATVERLGRELREGVVAADHEGSPALRAALEELPEVQREAILLAA